MTEPETEQEPLAVLIVPRDRKYNEVIAAFLFACTKLDLSVHSDSNGDHIRAVAW